MSYINECLAAELKQRGIGFERELKFSPHRRFRADFRILGTPLLVEVDGGSWVYGRHNRPGGFLKDREKDAIAFREGYIPMHFSPEQVKSGEAVRTINIMLEYLNLGWPS